MSNGGKMGIKQYLKQAFTIDRLIKAKKIRIQYLRDQLEMLNSLNMNTKVQANGSKDRLGDTVAMLVDTIADVEKDIAKLVQLQRDMSDLIANVERGDLRLVLYERYINFKKWEDIAVDNNYSLDNIFKLHGRALQAIEKVYSKLQ